jgi:NTE family protein
MQDRRRLPVRKRRAPRVIPLARCHPMRVAATAAFLSLAVLVGCASRPINPPLQAYDPAAGYRPDTANLRPGTDQATVMALAFSGGGTRAAAFSYGVLEELRRTPIVVDGKPRRLLDEVDFISGVSGGSFTALAYALHGERLFDDYDSRFLKRDVQGDLIARVLSPAQWPRLASGGFGRSELAAEYYDEVLFAGATFGDLVARATPRVMIAGTDLSTGSRFGFTQNEFDHICSDLSRVRLSRAAAASSAVPVVLSPVTFNNYAGRCGLQDSEGVAMQLALASRGARLQERSREIALLRDSAQRPYLHVVDGGVSDNLGLRAILEGLEALEMSGETRALLNVRNFRRAVVIVVNAQSGIRADWDRSETPPGSIEILLQAAGVPIDRYSYESLQHLRSAVERWNAARELDAMRARLFGQPEGDAVELKLYSIDVSFDAVADPVERDYLKALPTSFVLPPEDVDRLRATAARVLRESPGFRDLVRELGGAPAQ